MKLEAILEQYSAKKNLGKLAFDSSGICRVIINENSIVTFEKSLDGQGFYAYAPVGKIPPETEREVCLMALWGNLFGRETGQAILGYLPNTKTLVLFEYFDEGTTTYAEFERKFDMFVGYLAYWMNKIASQAAPSFEEMSLNKHLSNLQEHRNMKIFFA